MKSEFYGKVTRVVLRIFKIYGIMVLILLEL